MSRRKIRDGIGGIYGRAHGTWQGYGWCGITPLPDGIALQLGRSSGEFMFESRISVSRL
jgi:hypothetical protein